MKSIFVYIISAFDSENDLVATFAASNYDKAVEISSQVMEMDDNICFCGFSGTNIDEVISNVTVH